MRIGELAELTGVSTRALRYYDERNLLAPTRLPSGYRDYGTAAVATVQRIQILMSAGLSSSTIAEILPCVADDSVVLAGRCPELLEGLRIERARITQKIDELRRARSILDSLVGLPMPTIS